MLSDIRPPQQRPTPPLSGSPPQPGVPPQIPPSPQNPQIGFPAQPTQPSVPPQVGPMSVPPQSGVPQPSTFPHTVEPNPIDEEPAPPQTPRQPSGGHKNLVRGFLSFGGFVLSVVLLATLINMFVFQSYYVDGTSMTPTLEPNERLIINKLPRTMAKATRSHYIPKRGEIVVFNSNLISPENGEREQLIKRIIGLPGERVVVKDEKITIYNNEHPTGFNPDESLKLELSPSDGDIDVIVPENHLFVCGDNRSPGGSYDSRSEMGPIPSDTLVGELSMRLVPLNKAKFF